ncbi:MAG TPA: hypothetical protein VJ724_08390, partial [Tahibacter sp.]|nr:hypothetical protein [Tahibacter sp.]
AGRNAGDQAPTRQAPLYGQYAASAFDTRRRRILLAGGNANEHGYYDLATNAVQTVAFDGPNALSVSGDFNGMVYEPSLDAYLVRKLGAGGTVYRIDAQTFRVDELPTTGGDDVPVAVNAVARRFLYVPQLQGVVYAPAYDGDLWFLRTH